MHVPMKQGHNPKENARNAKTAGGNPLIMSFTEAEGRHTSFVLQIRRGLGPRYKIYSKRIGDRSQEIPCAWRRNMKYKVDSFQLVSIGGLLPGKHGVGNPRYMGILKYHERKRPRRKFA